MLEVLREHQLLEGLEVVDAEGAHAGLSFLAATPLRPADDAFEPFLLENGVGLLDEVVNGGQP